MRVDESATPTQLREINQRLVTLLAHELGAPLTHILAYLRLWQEAAVVSERVELNFVLDQALNLRQRLDDVLLLDQLEAGLWRIQPEPIFVHEVIARVVEAQRWQMEEKGIALATQIRCNRRVMADREMLFRAVQELVVNAYKFSRANSRTMITVECDDGMCCIQVEDQGSGISPQKQAQLFQPLFEPQAREMGRYGGLGIGLKLVRAIAEKHHGRIHVASQLGRGSTFTLTIPLA